MSLFKQQPKSSIAAKISSRVVVVAAVVAVVIIAAVALVAPFGATAKAQEEATASPFQTLGTYCQIVIYDQSDNPVATYEGVYAVIYGDMGQTLILDSDGAEVARCVDEERVVVDYFADPNRREVVAIESSVDLWQEFAVDEVSGPGTVVTIYSTDGEATASYQNAEVTTPILATDWCVQPNGRTSSGTIDESKFYIDNCFVATRYVGSTDAPIQEIEDNVEALEQSVSQGRVIIAAGIFLMLVAMCGFAIWGFKKNNKEIAVGGAAITFCIIAIASIVLFIANSDSEQRYRQIAENSGVYVDTAVSVLGADGSTLAAYDGIKYYVVDSKIGQLVVNDGAGHEDTYYDCEIVFDQA